MVSRFMILGVACALVACDGGTKGSGFVEGGPDVQAGPGLGDVQGIGGGEDGGVADAAHSDAVTPGGGPDGISPGDVAGPDVPSPDTVAVDAGPQDTGGPQKCQEGATRCFDGAAWLCSGGAWSKVHDCDGPCIGGECGCAPTCADRECGPDGCGGSCGTCSGATCEFGQCVPPIGPTVYAAIYVEDRWGGACSGSNSPGADITGAELYNPAGQLVGYWSDVLANPGTEQCSNSNTDPSAVLGQPGSAQLSLAGGWVIGTFDGKNSIGPGWTVTVYELGSQGGGTDEAFAVYLAPDLDCAAKPDAKETCLKLVSENGKGITSFVIPE